MSLGVSAGEPVQGRPRGNQRDLACRCGGCGSGLLLPQQAPGGGGRAAVALEGGDTQGKLQASIHHLPTPASRTPALAEASTGEVQPMQQWGLSFAAGTGREPRVSGLSLGLPSAGSGGSCLGPVPALGGMGGMVRVE